MSPTRDRINHRLWAAALIGSAICATADVFVLSSLRADGSEFEALLKGKHVYSAEVDLNGARSNLRVSVVSRALDETMRECERALGGTHGVFYTGSQMGRGLLEREGRVTRLLVFANDASQCVLYALNQSKRDYETSKRPPQRNLLTELPMYGGSVPELFMRDRETGTTLAIETSDAPPARVLTALATDMRADGWIPLSASANAGGAIVYARKDLRATLHVGPGPGGGGSRITRLHKEPGVE